MMEEKDSGSLPTPPPDAAALMAQAIETAQQLLVAPLASAAGGDQYRVLDPRVIARTWLEALGRAWENPGPLLEAQAAFWIEWLDLYRRAAARALGVTDAPAAGGLGREDKRFKDEAWTGNVAFDFVRQSYLLASRVMLESVDRLEGLDEHTRRKLAFYTRQFVNAVSPTNFASTNPQVIKATLDSGGRNLMKGLAHLLADLERGDGRLRISMTDRDAFRLGENIAATPGEVVWQNELMQLIQYAPSTATVFRRPLLIVPPWINKYYVLDLRPRTSFIKWAVDQGHTVFVISWVNPDERLGHKRFDDYLLEGPLAALDAIRKATGEDTANVIGYCIGGTLLGCTLGYLAVKGEAPIASATYFASLLDFSEVGDLSVFIDEEQIQLMEAHMRDRGYFDGAHMADAFNLLRENDLIWSFYVNNYLLGREPAAFDILYWNSDSTRLPAAMHSFYLRAMYLHNRLREPGGVVLNGVPLDLSRVAVPSYFLSTREDHIAPWTSTYVGTRLVSGLVTFVLAGSGHIAGVVNPPAAKKYWYWTNPTLGNGAADWLAGAERHEGSWWEHWAQWIMPFAGERVAARQPGDGALAPIEAAPGSYVKVQTV